MKTILRTLVALVAAGTALSLSMGTSHAALDNELSQDDGQGRTLNIQQWDVVLNGVTPLDGNPLTREWFENGRAVYHVTGDDADDFSGTLELGYQVSFPWQMGNGVNFSYTTPNFNLDQSDIPGIFSQNGALLITSPPLLPGTSVAVDVGNGPGLHEVSTFKVDVSGADGAVAIAGAHGSVTGASGGVTLRPFARLTSKEGDSVTTYGAPWEMH
ncbi:MAG TPA: MspA family porin [Mycobacterium sp.]|nr:MspA family porin [Mycobacterium sp.]